MCLLATADDLKQSESIVFLCLCLLLLLPATTAVYVAYTHRLLEAASKENFKRCDTPSSNNCFPQLPDFAATQGPSWTREPRHWFNKHPESTRCVCVSLPVCSPQVLDPATVCSAKLSVQDATILALSADQLLLACVSGNTVRVYSLPHLLSHQSDLPVHTLQMDQPLMQFAWSPDAADSTQYLALTAGRVLLHGSLPTGSASLAEHVDGASWSPDGQHVAYSSGSRLVVTGVDWKDSAFKVDLPPPDGQGV